MAFLPLMFAIGSPGLVSGIILHAPQTGIPDEQEPTTLTSSSLPGGWDKSLIRLPDPPLLRSLRVPVLITLGEHRVAGDADTLSPYLETCRVSILPKSGSLIASLQKSEFLPAVLAFAHEISGIRE
jgi:hypothetical protein